ncbi:hypothetical protein ACH4S8_36160 [Streptomyces sp. NPDC021080]|uniref:DUF7847 domain-containing protein n=1 Tax=Streptomyces sp. NPDC021080 TaxID=3365110 RepID=UPI0037B4D1BE
MPPPPPKPGVIPLAPLGVDHILGGAFATMRRYAKPLFGLTFLGVAILAGLTLGLDYLAYLSVKTQLDRIIAAPRSVDWTDLRTVLIAFGAVWVVGMVVSLVASSFVQASSAATLHDAVLGRRAQVGAVWKRAWSRTPSVLGVTLLLGLVVVVPLVLLVVLFGLLLAAIASKAPLVAFSLFPLVMLLAIPLAVWLFVRFSFAPAAAVLEGASPVTAMRRSARLVRGAWWRTFGILLLGGLITLIVSLVVNVPFQLAMPTPQPYDLSSAQEPVSVTEVYAQILPSMGRSLVLSTIASLFVQLFSLVFMPLVGSLLYIDQRIRREGLADVLMRAAAVTEAPGGPGTPEGPAAPGGPEAPGGPGTPGSVE